MDAERDPDLRCRAAVHAALGEPTRLAIADALLLGEMGPSELQALLALPSNLLAHHVGVLERAGVVRRTRSEGDRRRTYLGLVPHALTSLAPVRRRDGVRVVFVCTANSARSRLAAALWTGASPVPATSAGTHPAAAVHPGAVAAARRHALPLDTDPPRRLDQITRPGDLVVTVCDSAHEELPPQRADLHWSVPDPAATADEVVFDRTVAELADRIARLAPAVRPAPEGGSDVDRLPPA